MSEQYKKKPKSEAVESRLSELYLATVYGIEGLARHEEKEEWLDLFQTALEELRKPLRPETGGFKLTSSRDREKSTEEYLFPEESQRQEIVEGLEELSAFADRLKEGGGEEDEISEDEISEKIALAQDIRDRLEEAQTNP